MMQSEAEKMAVNVFLPAYALGDKEGCTFKDGKVYCARKLSRGLQEIC